MYGDFVPAVIAQGIQHFAFLCPPVAPLELTDSNSTSQHPQVDQGSPQGVIPIDGQMRLGK